MIILYSISLRKEGERKTGKYLEKIYFRGGKGKGENHFLRRRIIMEKEHEENIWRMLFLWRRKKRKRYGGNVRRRKRFFGGNVKQRRKYYAYFPYSP